MLSIPYFRNRLSLLSSSIGLRGASSVGTDYIFIEILFSSQLMRLLLGLYELKCFIKVQ